MTRQCVILVGGLGTRLGSLTADCPKPLLPVAGRPFLEYLIEQVAGYGFRDILLLAGCHGDQVVRHFSSRLRLRGCPSIRTIIEPNPMGTAGALVMCQEEAADQFLLVNGDSYFNCDIGNFVKSECIGPWLAKIALRQVLDASRYGVVITDANQRVLSFNEKPASKDPGMINSGVYWIKRELFKYITILPSSLERDIFPILVREGLLYGYPYVGGFIDIGTQETYAASHSELPAMLSAPVGL